MASYEVLSHAAIVYLTGLIRDLASVSEGVDDLHIRSDGTFSSVKIDTLIKQCLQDSNDYTDRLVANLSRLELKIATSESEITQPNIMYLYKPSGSTSYEQYVVIEGTKVLLGTTDINMGDYYTITQADGKFVLKTDFDSLKTEVDKKVNKTDIVDNLTSTDTDKPLSANQGKVLKDEVDLKANDSDVVKKTDIVTSIDSTSTNDKVVGAKAIKAELDKKVSNDCIQRGTGGRWVALRANTTDDKTSYRLQLQDTGIVYVYKTLNNWASVSDKNIVCTTKVADVPKTDIIFTNTTNYSIANSVDCRYFVKNGICTMILHVRCNIPNGWVTVADNIPKPHGFHHYQMLSNLDGTGFMRCSIRTNGKLELSRGAAGTEYIGTFSYTVAES